MAISPDRLALSTILFHQRGVSRRAQKARHHTHPFWQVECICSGIAELDIAGAVHRLPVGAPVVIPPGVEHGFSYPHAGCAFLSVKFQHPARPSGWQVAAAEPVMQHVAGMLDALVVRTGTPDQRAGAALGCALDLLIAWLWPQAPTPAPPPEDIAQRVDAWLDERLGSAVSVAGCAAALGLSASYAAARFKQAAGHSLKSHIDRRRAAHAEHLLRYADGSVAEVARACEFPDLAAFSRFFRRVTGRSPSSVVGV